MVNKLILLLTITTLFFSCKKDNGSCGTVNTSAPASEVETLQAYITANNITATKDSRGFFYSINTAGTGNKPTVCNAVQVDYTGKLTSGTVFDSGTGVSFYLSGLIVGWQEGIPLIAPGGSITLYLPPSLAYGSSANGSIPANSILVFDISLKAIY